VPGGIAGPLCLRGSHTWRPGPPGWGLGAGLTIQPRKKVTVTKPQSGGQGPIWAVEPYDDDDDDDLINAEYLSVADLFVSRVAQSI
jgi:hypothetical protein